MEIVNVLGNQGECTGFAGGAVRKLSQSPVGGVWSDGVELTAPLVVKTVHCFRRAGKCLRGCDLFDPMTGPQAAGGAESTEPGFHGHARAGQDEDVLVDGGAAGGHGGGIIAWAGDGWEYWRLVSAKYTVNSHMLCTKLQFSLTPVQSQGRCIMW